MQSRREVKSARDYLEGIRGAKRRGQKTEVKGGSKVYQVLKWLFT